MNLTRGINLTKIAEKMNGCSGAELKGVCTEAGMYALRERRVHVTQEDFDLATAKILNKHDDKVCHPISFCFCLSSLVLALWDADLLCRKLLLASFGSRRLGMATFPFLFGEMGTGARRHVILLCILPYH